MAHWTAAEQVAALRRWGEDPVERTGWRTRQHRDYPRGFVGAVALVIHDTGARVGTAPVSRARTNLAYVTSGEPGKSGPLYNAGCYGGTVELVAAGPAIHSYSCDTTQWDRAKAGTLSLTAQERPNTDGKSPSGITTRIPQWADSLVVYDLSPDNIAAAIRFACAWCDFHDRPAGSILYHAEETTQRVDLNPQSVPLRAHQFRVRVRDALRVGPPGSDPATPDNRIAISVAHVKAAHEQFTADGLSAHYVGVRGLQLALNEWVVSDNVVELVPDGLLGPRTWERFVRFHIASGVAGGDGHPIAGVIGRLVDVPRVAARFIRVD